MLLCVLYLWRSLWPSSGTVIDWYYNVPTIGAQASSVIQGLDDNVGSMYVGGVILHRIAWFQIMPVSSQNVPTPLCCVCVQLSI